MAQKLKSFKELAKLADQLPPTRPKGDAVTLFALDRRRHKYSLADIVDEWNKKEEEPRTLKPGENDKHPCKGCLWMVDGQTCPFLRCVRTDGWAVDHRRREKGGNPLPALSITEMEADQQ